MQALTEGPVWGMFDDSHMDADIDRQYFHPTQPSIADMTAKAIELLSEDNNGFFLMVEGSQVDWAGHNNDPVYMTTDFLAFDEAVKVACDFADRNGNTLVMAFPDHNTGGMKIGHYYTAMGYTETTIEDLVNPLKGMTITSGGLVNMLGDDSDNELIAKVLEYWGLSITQEDVNEIRELETYVGLNYALARVLSKNYTAIGWATHGHNGETVPLWIHGADNVKLGIVDNTDLAKIGADALNLNLARATKKLYVDLDTVTDDYEIVDDGYGNLTVWVAGAELPVNKDFMMVVKKNGRKKVTYKMPGLTVYAPQTEKVYISKKAVKKLAKLGLN